MSPLFGKKQEAQAIAEVLEDGGAIFSAEMKKPNRGGYHEYRGSAPILEIAVRVQPENEPPFEAKLKVVINMMNLLNLGVRVQVKYDPVKKQEVTLDDDIQTILKRNPQMIKKQGGL
jgi:hypothetical protein